MANTCKVIFNGGVAGVYNNDGTPSSLYQEALEYYNDQTTALDVWKSTYSDEYQNIIGKSPETSTLKDVLGFLSNYTINEASLTNEELLDVVEFMSSNGVRSLEELSTKLEAIFKPNGYFEINTTTLVKSGLYSQEEANSIDPTKMLTLLNKIESMSVDMELEVSPDNVSKLDIRLTQGEKTAFGTFKKLPITDIIDFVVKRTNSKSQEDVIATLNTSETFANVADILLSSPSRMKYVMDTLSDKRSVPQMFINNEGELIGEDVSTEKTVVNTLLFDADTIEISADVEFLESIPEAVWMNKQENVKRVVAKIEKRLIDFNIDVIGLSEVAPLDREGTLVLLESVNELLLTPSPENIRIFADVKTTLLGAEVNNKVINNSFPDINLTYIETNLTAGEMFDRYNMLKVGDNLYHNVVINKEEAYQELYNRLLDGVLDVPQDIFSTENPSDATNVENTLTDLKNFISSRDIGFYSNKFEDISLAQVLFGYNSPIETPPTQMLENEDYLTTEFVSDFYQYILQEKLNNTDVYNRVLKHFNISDTDINLNTSITPDVTGIKYEKELREYASLKKEGQIKELQFPENIDPDLDVYYMNNPRKVAETSGNFVQEGEYLVKQQSNDLYTRVGNEIYRKVFSSTDGKDVFQKVNIPTDGTYFQTNFNFDTPVEKAEKLANSLPTPTKVVESVEVIKQRTGINNKVEKDNKAIVRQVIEQLNKTGLARKVHILSPKEMNNTLKRLGVNSGIRKQIAAWHGSPHKFPKEILVEYQDGTREYLVGTTESFPEVPKKAKVIREFPKGRFRLDKIGSGEGAQAFGWGNYFTDLESIARGYAEDLTNEKLQDLGEFTIKGFEKLEDFEYFSNELSYLGENKRGEQALNELRDILEKYSSEVDTYSKSSKKEDKDYVEYLKEQIELINYIIPKAENRLKNIPKENLYKVTLHRGKTPEQYTWLEWDKGLNKETAKKLGVTEKDFDRYQELNAELNISPNDSRFDGLIAEAKALRNKYPDILGRNGEDVYKSISEKLGGQKQASLFLLESGIDGIKYPAESISRGTTSDTARGFNYVVFDENAVTIEENIQFQKPLLENGIQVTPNGFVYNSEVFFNDDVLNSNTAIHEFAHLYSSMLKNTNTDLYNKGLSLIEQEGQVYIDFVKQTQPNLKGEFLLEEALAEAVGDFGYKLVESTTKNKFIQFLNDLWNAIKGKLGLSSYTIEEVNNMSLTEYIEAVNTDLLSGERLMQEIRTTDQLPLTLAVFNRPEFEKMKGKMVNPVTILNSLNQQGIKQIEKDLIKSVIEENYQGQKKVSYDELELKVRVSLMPLERIFTSSYANYGMDNLGDGNYGEANTIILNAPIEHGVTGHFSGDFKVSGRKSIKYVPKQLDGNTWIAVEEGYESGANEGNIYQFVGTAGTKEVVDNWINNYELSKFKWVVYTDTFDEAQGKVVQNIVAGFDTEQEAQKYWEENKDNFQGVTLDYNTADETGMNTEAINKGMFAHMRVWQDGDIFYVAEAQSDYFQKNNARKNILESNTEYIKAVKESIVSKRPITQRLKETKFYKDNTAEYEGTDLLVSFTKRLQNNLLREDDKKIVESVIADLKVEDKKLDRKVEEIIKSLPKDEKQFIASQKEWEKRLLREALKEASLSGATTFRLPTPYTLSVIEGYLSEGTPYYIENANDSNSLEAGDGIYYAGEYYTVVDSDNTTITIAESGRVQRAEEQDIIDNEIEDSVDNDMYKIENNLKDFYTQEEWNDFRDNYSPISSTELDKVGNEIEEGVFEVSEGKIRDIVTEYYEGVFTDAEGITRDIYRSDVWVSGNTVTWTDGRANIETLMQPSEYKRQDTKDSFSIEDDLDDTQQTVARKYEEIAEILRKERGEENVEIVTDENGFDWYETKLTPGEVNNPIIAFQLPQNNTSVLQNTNNTTQNLLEKGQITIGDTTVHFKPRINPITDKPTGQVELDLIETTESSRGQGNGRRALKEFLNLADAQNVEIYLIASPRDKNTTTEGLIEFYESVGFKSVDSFFPEEMVRKPKKQSKEASITNIIESYPISELEEVAGLLGLEIPTTNTLFESGDITYTNEDGKPCAEFGGKTSFTKGGAWTVVKEIKGSSHKQGGVDLEISDKGVKVKQNDSEIKAENGLVIQAV